MITDRNTHSAGSQMAPTERGGTAARLSLLSVQLRALVLTTVMRHRYDGFLGLGQLVVERWRLISSHDASRLHSVVVPHDDGPPLVLCHPWQRSMHQAFDEQDGVPGLGGDLNEPNPGARDKAGCHPGKDNWLCDFQEDRRNRRLPAPRPPIALRRSSSRSTSGRSCKGRRASGLTARPLRGTRILPHLHPS